MAAAALLASGLNLLANEFCALFALTAAIAPGAGLPASSPVAARWSAEAVGRAGATGETLIPVWRSLIDASCQRMSHAAGALATRLGAAARISTHRARRQLAKRAQPRANRVVIAGLLPAKCTSVQALMRLRDAVLAPRRCAALAGCPHGRRLVLDQGPRRRLRARFLDESMGTQWSSGPTPARLKRPRECTGSSRQALQRLLRKRADA